MCGGDRGYRVLFLLFWGCIVVSFFFDGRGETVGVFFEERLGVRDFFYKNKFCLCFSVLKRRGGRFGLESKGKGVFLVGYL